MTREKTTNAVEVRGLVKHFGTTKAVDGIDLDVREGTVMGVLGPNGAGKTTLVEIVEGMRQADSGTVEVFGQSPWPRNMALLRRIGVQTQTSAFFTRLTAREHLETVAALHGLDRAAAHRALDSVGLGDKARSRVDDLSGGQRQRLALGTGIGAAPDVLLADEPTSKLDPVSAMAVVELLLVEAARGTTVIAVTHDPRVAAEMDLRLDLHDGRLAS